MKDQYIVKLTGIQANGSLARLGEEVAYFIGASGINDRYFKITKYPEYVSISTPLGTYQISFNCILNIFKGSIATTKVHVTLKKISGKLIYWA